ncbi:AAA family ATPase [Shewanella baltica]|uniref:AAA family ATPase n=1 Tax=Shewanella baltica TaxID=62322 RepID=UPI003D020C8E
MMRVKHLHLKNMRGLKDIELTFKPGVNLLVGSNSVGKSTVLEGLRVMLSALTSRLEGDYRSAYRFKARDVKKDTSCLSSELLLDFQERSIRWNMQRYSHAGEEDHTQTSDYDALNEAVKSLEIAQFKHYSLPIALYYNVHRAVKHSDLQPDFSVRKVRLEPVSALENALAPTGTDFEQIQKWFAYRSTWFKKNSNVGKSAADKQLTSVVKAIESFLPAMFGVWFDESTKTLHTRKNGIDFELSELSDGEQSLLALVADISRRLATANPDLDNPLAGDAVVLVDEIDLHLHPAWQRKIVALFEKTFPNAQFIFTTHSPQILSHVTPDSIWLFQRNDEGEVEPYQPDTSFGMDSSSILKLLFDVSEREETTEQQLKQLVQLVDANQLEEGKELITDLQSKCGDIELLKRMAAVIWRKELLAGRDVKD